MSQGQAKVQARQVGGDGFLVRGEFLDLNAFSGDNC